VLLEVAWINQPVDQPQPASQGTTVSSGLDNYRGGVGLSHPARSARGRSTNGGRSAQVALSSLSALADWLPEAAV